jgi:hypothetical protein
MSLVWLIALFILVIVAVVFFSSTRKLSAESARASGVSGALMVLAGAAWFGAAYSIDVPGGFAAQPTARDLIRFCGLVMAGLGVIVWLVSLWRMPRG